MMKKFIIIILFLIIAFHNSVIANCRLLAYYPDWVASYK